jgi:hypothetical protein
VRGQEHWDGLVTHNPTVHAFDGKYYLYYTGNTRDDASDEKVWWNHRNRQRIGVAIADHPNGPWQRFAQPLIDVGSTNAPDALMTSNPSICRRPDGTYVLVYKAVGLEHERPFGGPVVHMVATSDSPSGPFKKHESLVFTKPGEKFPAEDPTIWTQDNQLWAIVKDMEGVFTRAGKSLALFESTDGIDWKLAANPLVSRLQVTWDDGEVQKLHSLERPQLWLDNGVPAILFCAARTNEDTAFNVHIPLGATLR